MIHRSTSSSTLGRRPLVALDLGPLCNEVSQHLGLDGRPRGIRNALTHQLECPLHDSSHGILVLDDLAKGEGRHDRHRM